jgi:hypothetical protein
LLLRGDLEGAERLAERQVFRGDNGSSSVLISARTERVVKMIARPSTTLCCIGFGIFALLVYGNMDLRPPNQVLREKGAVLKSLYGPCGAPTRSERGEGRCRVGRNG